MAISNYKGTTNQGGSNSGWEARFVTHFCDATGMQYRVEIIDSELTQTDFGWTLDAPKEFVCGSDGFTLTHEGSPDNLHQSIVSSSLTLDFLIQNADDEKLFTALSSTTDHRFGIAVFKFRASHFGSLPTAPIGVWALEWCGVINPENVSLELGTSSKFLRLDAIDGLALLNEIPYLDDAGNAYDTWINFKGIIAQCLKHIPTASLWGFGNGSSASNVNSSTASTLDTYQPPFFIETIYQWDSVAHDAGTLEGFTSVLSYTGCQSQSFYSFARNEDRFGGIIKDTQSISCSEVLDQIASLLRARIFLADGSFQFQNPTAMVAVLSSVDVVRWPTLYRMDYAAHDALGTGFEHRQNINNHGFDIVNGADDSFLHPIKTATSIHVNGGSSSLFGNLGNGGFNQFANIYKNTGTIDHAFNTHSNTYSVCYEGQALHLSGSVSACVNYDNINAVSNFPDHVGAKIVLEFRFKIGNYYLKGNVANLSGTVNIQRNLASDITYRSIVRDGDVEWTTVASSYFIVVPNHLCNPYPPVAIVSEVEYIGGFNITMNGNSSDEFHYNAGFLGSGGTNNPLTEFDLSWTLPPLPVGTHTGSSMSYAMKLYEAGGNQITDDESSIFNLSDFNEHSRGAMVRFDSLHLNTGAPNAENDASYSATQSANSASMIASSSVLGNQINNAWLGIMSVEDSDNPGNYSASGEVWSSKSNPTAVKNIHELNALECLQERGTSLRTRRCSLAFGRQNAGTSYSLNDNVYMPTFNNSFRFDDEDGTPQFIPTSLVWTASPATIDFNGFLAFIQTGIVPVYYNTLADTSTSSGFLSSDEFDQTFQGHSLSGIKQHKITQIDQSVKDNIIVSTANTTSIAAHSTSIGANSHDIGTNTAGLGANSTSISTNATDITTNVTSIATNATDITTNVTSIATNATDITTNVTSIATNTADISTNVTSIATNASDIATNTSDIADVLAVDSAREALYIKVMPSEFHMNDDYARAPLFIEDDVSGSLSVGMPASSTELFAFVNISKGYKATDVIVYATVSTTSAVEVFEFNHTTGAITSKGTGNFNATIDITDVSAHTTDGTVVIKVSPASVVTRIYGATITLASL